MSMATEAHARGAAEAPQAARPRTFVPFEKSELEQSIGSRFERIAQTHAQRPAVRESGRSWTYAELNAAANRVARALAAGPGEAEGPIALLMPAGAALFAAMLGALKAGRFYVPLDPALGDGRLAAILAQLAVAVLMTDEASRALAERLSAGRLAILQVDPLTARGPAEDPGAPVSPGALAYVLFTSGSTGAPKGVMHSHRNLLHNVSKLTNGLQIGPEDRLTLLSSPSFGASVSDIFGALLNGACVCPFSVRGDGLGGLADFVEREGITVFHSVPSVYRAFAAALDGRADLSKLRIVKLGGEPILASDFELYRRRFPRGCLFHAGLGSTEVHVIRQWFADHDTPWPGAAPLGYAVDGTDVLLLDEDGREAAEQGEIAIVSTTLPLGYWGDPIRTAEAFRPAPGREGARLYRTGDLGRLLADGCLLYAGRKDSRLKVRGNRVEPEEVEAALTALPGVREAAVAGRDGPEGLRLVAYVVRGAGSRAGIEALRRGLAERLPDFMVPSSFVFLDGLPRTASGKVDREALPAPEPVRPPLEAGFVRPRGEVEETVSRVFAEVLGLDRVGAADDFFDLGGSSLSAIEVLARVHELFGGGLSAVDFLEAPTPAALAARLRDGRAAPANPLVSLQRGTRGPVFLVPGGAGDGADLLVSVRLARSVGAEFTFLGLRSGSAAPLRFDDLAAWGIRQMRAVQPHGPYVLVGECVGGILAFAMACRLRQEGEEIALLALLDTPFPTRRRRLLHALRPLRAPWGDNLSRRLRHHWRILRGLEPARRGAYILEKARVAVSAMASVQGEDRRPLLRRRASYVGLLFGAPVEPFDGPIRLVVSEEGDREGFPTAWARLAPRVDIARVPGDHGTYLPEQVDRFAEVLRRWLEETAPG
jgi:amino acid adenylation domain-containing protein